ncbi:MAG: autotransporter-associated beta strand repeat-containing protein [Luteolibacter sp.]
MKPKRIWTANTIRIAFCAVATFSAVTATSSAQLTKFGKLNVVQNDAGNNATSVTLSVGAGSSGGILLPSGTSRGDFTLNLGPGTDPNFGVLIPSVSQLSRDNTATGDASAPIYATASFGPDTATGDFWIAVSNCPTGDEANINVAFAFFPYNRWVGGIARNTVNNGAITSVTGTTGLRLGTEFVDNTTAGVFTLNINSFTANGYTTAANAAANGVLLVSGAKNEDNYALSKANADGTFTLYCHDNGSNSTSHEQDGVGFAYLRKEDVGSNNLIAIGRVNGDATTDVASGGFTVTKDPTLAGTWYLTIPGQTESTGTLVISPEGGDTNNVDNIVSYGWDAANNRWIIESRDISGSTVNPTLQNMASKEDVFSFAFFKSPPTAYASGTFTGNAGDTVADADFGTAGNQPAVIGTSAFSTIGSALATSGSLAPFILNGGTYDEAVDLTDENSITLTGPDAPQTAVIGSLTGQAGSTFIIGGSSQVDFGSNNTSTVFDGTLSGGPNAVLVKSGTGQFSLNSSNTGFTGTVLINGGTLVVNDLGLGGDLNAKQITVNDGGVLVFGPDGNPDFPNATQVTLNTGGRFDFGQGENYGKVTIDGGEFRFVSTARTNVNNQAYPTALDRTVYDLRSGSVTTQFSGAGTGGALSTGTGTDQGVLVKSTTGTLTLGAGVTIAPTMEMQVKEGVLAIQGNPLAGGTANLVLGDTTTTATLRVDGSAAPTSSRPIVTGTAGGVIEVTTPSGSFELGGNVSGTGTLTLTGNGTVYLAPSVRNVISAPFGGSGSVVKYGSGTTVIDSDNPFTGTLSVSEGRLVINGSIAGNVTVEDDYGTLSGEGTIGTSLTLGTSSGGKLEVDASTEDALAVTGLLDLVGSTQVSFGSFSAATGTVSVPILSYGTLSGDASTGLYLAEDYNFRPGSGAFTNEGGNSRIVMSLVTKSLTWHGDNAYWDVASSSNWVAGSSDQFFYGDVVTFDDTAISTTVDLAGKLLPGRIIVDSDVNQFQLVDTSGGYIGGAGSLVKRGTSTLVMDAVNTYTGGTVISEGTIEMRDVSALGSGSVTLGDEDTGSGNVALYTGGARLNVSNPITVSANGTGTATLGTRATVTGTGDGNQFTSIALQRNVIFDSNAADRTDYENITGTGDINVTGAGRSIFPTTPALWSGNLRVSTTGTGNLQIGVASVAGDYVPDSSSVTVDTGAVFSLSTAGETIAGLNGGGRVISNSPSGGATTLTLGSANAAGNFSGVVEGSAASNILSLVKTGTGKQVLSGNNTYSGTTTVSGGTLQIGDGGASGDLSAGAITVAAGAKLSYLRTGAVIQDGALNSTGAVGASSFEIGGDATTQVTLAAAGNFSGQINVNQGTLVFGITNTVGTTANAPNLSLAPGTVVTNLPDTTHTHLGAVQLAGGSTLTTASGTANYNGENYQINGDVTVSGGTTAAVITREATRTNADSGISLHGTRTFTVADVTGSSAPDLIISTEIEPSSENTGVNIGALVKTGPGTLQLAGDIVHSYTGSTTVQQGTLMASGSITGTLAVQSGATLAPGASAGSFAAGATTIGGTYACEINGAQSDVLQVTGNLTLSTGSSLVVSSIGATPSSNTYVIASYSGTRSGTFTNVSGVPSGYTVNYDDVAKQVQLVRSTADAFSSWLTTNGLNGAGATVDSDGDGIANILEFVLGGVPSGSNSNSRALLPTVAMDENYLLFTYRLTDEATYLQPYVEYGSGLSGWTRAQDGTSGVIITVQQNGFGNGVDSVLVKIPRSLATDSRFFARLGVTAP